MLKGLLQFIIILFKRLACFLNIRRGRKPSGSLLPTHHSSKSSPYLSSFKTDSNNKEEDGMLSWDVRWGNENSNDKVNQTPLSPLLTNDPEVDLFLELEPRVGVTKKIYVGPAEDVPINSSRFAVSNDVDILPPQMELGEWVDDSGWDVDESRDFKSSGRHAQGSGAKNYVAAKQTRHK